MAKKTLKFKPRLHI
jgi:hypothetical protein